MGEQLRNEGASTCRKASYIEGEALCAVRFSASLCWSVYFYGGVVYSANTSNRYYVCGSSESFPDCDGWIEAERSFFKNKHDSTGAQRVHIHPSKVMQIARIVEKGEYKPKPGYCFPLKTPAPREIYAAFCSDRLVHHYVAPFIASVAESVHNANGDISHGNRIGHSAQTGAEQIREAIKEAQRLYPDPYVAKVDIRSFFSSIPRQKAYEALEYFANKYYSGEDKERKLSLCKTLILHDPVKGCVELSGDWGCVPPRKRLKNSKPGHGLPIGNFYSQLIANLFLAIWDMMLARYGISPRFVDDKCGILKDKATAKAFVESAKKAAECLGLELHPDKKYIQPVHKGVNFCGRTIKGDRLYLSNKTINRCYYNISRVPVSKEGARKVCSSVNSYIGLMCHCTEYKNQKKLCEYVLKNYGEWLYFVAKKGKFTCRVKKRFTERSEHEESINNLITVYNETSKTNRRVYRPCGSGRREGSRRAA